MWAFNSANTSKIVPGICSSSTCTCAFTILRHARLKFWFHFPKELWPCNNDLWPCLWPCEHIVGWQVFCGGLVAKSCPTLWPHELVTHQAPLSMGFSRQEYWSGLPFPSPWDLPNPGIEPRPLHCRQIPYQLSYKGCPDRLELKIHCTVTKL